MDSTSAIEALSALAQEHRLALFRLLVQAGQRGMAAGAIAEALGIPNSSLSFHLAQLRGAKLIEQERQHRTIIYRANYPAMNALMAYLMENRSEEHTSELQSLMRISYAVFCLKKNKPNTY